MFHIYKINIILYEGYLNSIIPFSTKMLMLGQSLVHYLVGVILDGSFVCAEGVAYTF